MIKKDSKNKSKTNNKKSKKNPAITISQLMKNSFMAKILEIFTTNPLKKYNFRQIPKFDLKKMVKLMKMDKKATSNSIVFIFSCCF